MFFRVLCPLTDCVWKLSPDKSKGLSQVSCCVVQFQTPAAAMVYSSSACMSSSWWYLFPVCWGACVTFQCSELGIVLRCLAPAHSVFLHVSLCALHEAQMKCSQAWLERISTSSVFSFL